MRATLASFSFFFPPLRHVSQISNFKNFLRSSSTFLIFRTFGFFSTSARFSKISNFKISSIFSGTFLKFPTLKMFRPPPARFSYFGLGFFFFFFFFFFFLLLRHVSQISNLNLNANGGFGFYPKPRPSEGRLTLIVASTGRTGPFRGPLRRSPWSQVHALLRCFPSTRSSPRCSSNAAGLGSQFSWSQRACRMRRTLCAPRVWAFALIAGFRGFLEKKVFLTCYFFPTADRTRLPAEFKHIPKRRKQN